MRRPQQAVATTSKCNHCFLNVLNARLLQKGKKGEMSYLTAKHDLQIDILADETTTSPQKGEMMEHQRLPSFLPEGRNLRMRL